MKKPPASSRPPVDRATARKRKRRRLKMMRLAIVLTVLLLLALIISLVVLHISGSIHKQNGTKTEFLAVTAIEVEEETRYTPEQIIEASGLFVGESLLVVNKVEAHNAILAALPYLEYVDISNSSFSTIHIAVRETRVLGAVQTADGYVVLGDNNHALERLAEEDVPADMLRIFGAETVNETVGETLLAARDIQMCRTLVTAADTYELEHLSRINLQAKTNVRIRWKEQIEVVLGNESNFPAQIKALTGILPTLLTNNGEAATGRLDMTFYADDDASNDRAIFSPMAVEDLEKSSFITELPSSTTGAESDPSASTTTTTAP